MGASSSAPKRDPIFVFPTPDNGDRAAKMKRAEGDAALKNRESLLSVLGRAFKFLKVPILSVVLWSVLFFSLTMIRSHYLEKSTKLRETGQRLLAICDDRSYKFVTSQTVDCVTCHLEELSLFNSSTSLKSCRKEYEAERLAWVDSLYDSTFNENGLVGLSVTMENEADIIRMVKREVAKYSYERTASEIVLRACYQIPSVIEKIKHAELETSRVLDDSHSAINVVCLVPVLVMLIGALLHSHDAT
jgi:hypothetical protein